MLKIVVPGSEQFDPGTEMFITTKRQMLSLEHSLVSVSKWEAKWNKPYFSRKPRTWEESIDYVRCMTLTQNVNPNVYTAITPDIFRQVSAYIEAPMTATTFPKNGKRNANREVITSEVIYYWMVFYGIPFECQKWHLNRLLTLIQVCNVKSQKPQKVPLSEVVSQNRELNAMRKKQWNTRG